MKIGVFGGSFNPVHNGHIELARDIVRQGIVDKVMMVLTPLNPLKADPESLVNDQHRMAMLRLACRPYPELEACDIELKMPRPNYSIDTLSRLQAEHPDDTFRLIIGADNWEIFKQWRRWEDILRNFKPIVYPRVNCDMPEEDDAFVTAVKGSDFPVSSTEIRQRLIKGEPVDELIPLDVLLYIRENDLYCKDNPQVSF